MHLCQSCHAGCCRSFAVPLTGADILKIQQEFHLSFWDFACRWADPDGLIARNYAPHFHFEDEPETPFTICLMHDKSRNFPKTTKCRFLMETPPSKEHPLGTGRCGVYEGRPSACRAFPTKLNATGDLAVIHEVPERGRSGDNPIYNLCPRPWTVDDVDTVGVVQDLVVARYEMSFFHKLAIAWNRKPGSWQVFPEFIELVYASRVQVDPKVAAQEEERRKNDSDSFAA